MMRLIDTLPERFDAEAAYRIEEALLLAKDIGVLREDALFLAKDLGGEGDG